MKSFFITASAAAALILSSHLAANAAGHTSRHNPNMIKVNVSYSFFVPGNTDTVENSAELHEKGRRMIYKIISNECAVLRETIADTCKLNRLNVTQRHMYRNRNRKQSGVTVGGRATYNVTMK